MYCHLGGFIRKRDWTVWCELGQRLKSAHPEWRLRIVGPDELGHARELAALAAELKTKRVSIEGPVAGDAKTAAYREADLFVLPTLNENFAITVAEALAAGTPVIATKGAPWRGLEREGCGWWVDHGVEPLAATLAEAMDMGRGVLRGEGCEGTGVDEARLFLGSRRPRYA